MKRFFYAVCVLALVSLNGWAQEIDMGDLTACYPTLRSNPGHALSDIAWLGECITADVPPLVQNQDTCDDGVEFLNRPWTPCTEAQVRVTVKAGFWYHLYQLQGEKLYLNAWKDGNLDGDFCDIHCDGRAPEWFIQDSMVTPGTWLFKFIDPGVEDFGIYEGILRFRLTSERVGPHGFGLKDVQACPDLECGSYAIDHLGEVEDYILPDLQLAVELGRFEAAAGNTAITLTWTTATETDNDHFELLRDGSLLARIPGAGTSATQLSYRFDDRDLTNGTEYSYSLKSVGVNGNSAVIAHTSAIPRGSETVITEYALHQNYPNPFNASSQIVFDLAENGFVRLGLYNLMGQQVMELVNSEMTTGRQTIQVDAGALPSGQYLYRLEANDFVSTKKMLLIK
ncbi:T9SS C-terminal target domain-containing protein [candidate division KSB1 bacterium]|nr:MAG: T9SS C-terminal target domain-containing protein [candidate division KSB1 bacterium]